MYKVLFVDDEPNICEGLKLIIDWESEGFGIAGVARNGSDALKQLESTAADIIITDVRMPEMSGIELVKKLNETRNGAKVIIISGFSEFEYAREALRYGVRNYILKPINRDMLESTVRSIKKELDHERINERSLKKQENFIREKLLVHLVKTGAWDQTDYDVGDWGKNLTDSTCCVSTVLLGDNRYADCTPREMKYDISKQIVKEIMGSTLEKHKCGYVFEPEQKDLLGALLYSGEYDMSYIKEVVLPELYTNIQHVTSGEMIIGLGNEAMSAAAIPESYRNSCRAAKWQGLVNGAGIAIYDNMEMDCDSDSAWDHSVLISKVRQCDDAGILHEMERLSRYADSLQQPNKALYSIMIGIFMELATMMNEIGGDLKTILDNEIDTGTVSANNDVLELVGFIEAACVKTAFHIKEKCGGFDHDVLNHIVQFVNCHYNTDLNLATLSNKFFLNQGYIGKLFKKHTGMGFVDYLNGVRMEKAAKLLEEGYLKTYEVCEEVGYKDLNYFYRIFKKFKGVSPAEYKKTIRMRKFS
ncbi:response regulator [Paenibacillus sp. MZ04-78.2]|uniref:response regulator transcription factor n=1 Tax=Paenibacillus sp. MZ04-78.2 TaxID=2962034 RepID=UPI0020B68D8D|nr:response regulator [Paenibacillus sp. MZ04-78.2]MCP3775063.1 response regulator [Paenibacillus sp. MZ04-78.2]